MYKVRITLVPTKSFKVIEFDEEWNETQEFLWSDGTYSCDCNRGIFYGREDAESCGMSKYKVTILIDDKIVYSD